MCVQLLICVRLSVAPWTEACQPPLSMEFSRQEYWSGLPFPTIGDVPYPEIKPISLVPPALADRFFTTESPGKSKTVSVSSLKNKSHESCTFGLQFGLLVNTHTFCDSEG